MKTNTPVSYSPLLKGNFFVPILCSLLVFLCLTLPVKAQDQNRLIDSLEQIARTTQNDTLRAQTWYQIGEACYETSHDRAIACWQKAVDLAGKKNSNKKVQKTLDILKGDALNDIAIILFYDGKIHEALEKNFESLKMREKTNDIHGLAESMNNLANVYLEQGDTASGLDYLKKSNVHYAQINDLGGVAYTYINMAKVFIDRHNDSLALEYLMKAKNMLETRPDLKTGLAGAITRIGNLYKRQKKTALAKSYLQRGVRLREEANDIIGRANAYTSMAAFYHEQNQSDSALYFAQKALSEKQAPLESRSEAALVSSKIYQKKGQFEKAFKYYQQYISIRDSLSNDKTRKMMLRNQYKYAYENKVATDSVQHIEEIRLNDERLGKEKTKQYALFIVAGVILVFSGFLYSRFRLIKKQKNIIQLQKNEVEKQRDIVAEKQKEIIDSINYAQRIQHAILAREEDIRKYFPESFLLYKPKDIVAGDFYFFETTDTHLFYAAADCTGHGVPGALVSVVCSNALTRCVKEFGLTDPGKILDKTRELVVETFKKSGQSVKDGMDISLISLKFDPSTRFTRSGQDLKFEVKPKLEPQTSNVKQNNQSSTNIELSWSGANNPLWVMNNNPTSGEPILQEIKPDKQPIGQGQNQKPFTTHSLSLSKGSILFLFTDGYADQFGGENGKKFKTANFQKLLLEFSRFDLKEQFTRLENTFDRWKGEYEQLDDVCVIGIKL